MDIEKLEELRKKLKNHYLVGFIIIIAITLPSILIRLYQIIPFIIILGIIIIVIFSVKKSKEFRKAFKDYFVLSSLKQYFTDLKYTPDKGIPYDIIAATKMMNMGDIYSSNDYISAKYKNISFEQSDVHIEEEHQTTDSDGNTSTTYDTIFMGRWMIFDFNKTFKANVQVSQKGFGNSKVQLFFGKKEQLYKKVKMESEIFNKSFNVYAQNEHDAFFILTPSLMEKVQRLETNNKGKLLLCFINNKLHVGLYDRKDSFEPGSIFKTINEEKERNKITKDIKMITQFVDELNLDNDLFRKEV